MKCDKCNLYFVEQMDVCPRCGNILTEKLKNQIKDEPSNNHIIKGTQLDNQIDDVVHGQSGDKKSKMLAFVLCFFFGYLGLHYFYVGKVGMGILYLFTIGLFGFGWLFDMIRIAGNCFKDANGNNLK